METTIIISGFGGQGVLFAGKLLAYAAMESGQNVTWIPSYGPEMRGGTANCTVIISDSEIGAPIVAHPHVALVLNLPSFQKYEPLVRPGGLLVINSGIMDVTSKREEIQTIFIDANGLAEVEGDRRMVNMAMIGAMLAGRLVLPIALVERTLAKQLPPDKQDLLQSNLRVLRAGYEVAQLAVT